MSILLELLHLYIFNNIHRFKTIAKFSLCALLAISLFMTVLVAIPFLGLLNIIGKVVDSRAKKIDNLINISIYFIISLFFVGVLAYPTYFATIKISTWLSKLLETRCQVSVDIFCIQLFLLISFLKLQVDVSFSIILFIKQKSLYQDNKKKLKKFGNNLNKNISFEYFDIKSYTESKANKIKAEEIKLKQSTDYDLNYFKNTLLRTELWVLIVAFILVALKLFPQNYMYFLDNHQGDIINIFTIYTLIMLYLDKRKEWK